MINFYLSEIFHEKLAIAMISVITIIAGFGKSKNLDRIKTSSKKKIVLDFES